MNSKTLSLLALCLTVSLVGCGKKNNGIPEPTKETCSLDYQKKHHLTTANDYESFTYPEFNNPSYLFSEKGSEREKKISAEIAKPFKHYYDVCEKIPGSWQYNQDATISAQFNAFKMKSQSWK